MPAVRIPTTAIAIAIAACGGGTNDDDDAVDAPAAVIDGAPLPDAPGIDAQARAASLHVCADVTGLISFVAEVTDMGYVPTGTGTVEVGHVAEYANAGGGVEHSLTSGVGGALPQPDGVFDTGPFTDHGIIACIRFDAPGVYPYHCAFHPTIEQGTITVP